MSGSYKLFLILPVICLANACSAAQVLEEGEWEMTTQTEMSGMPEGMPALPAAVHRQCLTNDMMVPAQANQGDQGCETIEQSVSGNTVTWRMRCTSNGITSEMNGSNTYSGDTMTGTMHMVSQGITMISHTTGKRIGPCK